ncbi:MAG: peptide chain release factor N(5)-glutamine methyltransferase [Candidatus Melainabacteria bacterium]|nr:MAG: peptide chain release factor N(5)-glutamine methyltransferase [Candidatus Melainabacteria bacterium]
MSSEVEADPLSFSDCQTIRQAREKVVKTLKNIGIERVEVRREADLIIEHVTRLSAVERELKLDESLAAEARQELETILRRRVKREPLQYCLGYGWFMGMRVAVQPGVFIPRTDTETLCDLTTKRLLNMGITGELRVLEVGVGSGCISVAMLREISNLQVFGVDVSQDALDAARLNARAYDVSSRLTLSRCDFREFSLSGFHAIVSNPPYIPKPIFDNLEPEVRDFEPSQALIGWGEDGMDFYRLFAKFALPKLIPPFGFAAVEVGDGQSEPVMKIMRSAGMNRVECIEDVNGLPRVVVAGIA